MRTKIAHIAALAAMGTLAHQQREPQSAPLPAPVPPRVEINPERVRQAIHVVCLKRMGKTATFTRENLRRQIEWVLPLSVPELARLQTDINKMVHEVITTQREAGRVRRVKKGLYRWVGGPLE
ncbi:hypothetical protein [Cupriavidus basilensis]|nr:hypothetical protein [Cupriavidus basilensis]